MTLPPISVLTPTATDLLGLIAVLAVLAGTTLLGAAASLGGVNNRTGAGGALSSDLFVGFGIVTIIFLATGTVLRLPLLYGFYALIALSAVAAGLLIRRKRLGAVQDGSILWRVLVLTAPLFLLIAGMAASQWDEFSHWLPNAAYLLHYDGFPATDKPPSPSGWPGYPYGTAFITYTVSTLTGRFVENAGIIANLAFLVAIAPLYLRCVGEGLNGEDGWVRGWRAAGFGFLGVTLLSTVFIQKLVFSNYADVPTAATFAVLVVLGWQLLNRQSDTEGAADARTIAVRFGLVAAFFLFVRQTNLVLFVLLLGTMIAVALRDPDIRFTRLLRHLPALTVPGAAVWIAWTVYKATEIGGGDFAFRPAADWNTHIIPDILAAMIGVAANKGAFFVMMTVLAVLACGWFLYPRGRMGGTFGRLAFLAGTVFVGYNAFLFLTYVAAFGEGDALRAASYWRYNSQLGLIGAMAAATGLAALWCTRLWNRPRAKTIAGIVGGLFVAVVLALPVAFHEKIRFDTRTIYTHYRAVVRDVARTLPPGSRLMVLDIEGQGQSGVMAKFEAMSGVGFGRDLDVGPYISAYQFKGTPESLREQVREGGGDHLLIYAAHPAIDAAFGLMLKDGAITLVRQTKTGWEQVRSWPYPALPDGAQRTLD